MSLFDRRYETLSRPELQQLQLERLQALLARMKRSVRRYRERFGNVRIESPEDIKRLPVTTPEEVAESFPYGMFTLPLREVIRLHSLVGPGGKPLVVGHTRNDLLQWGKLVARQLVAGGVTANDVVQLCLGGGVTRGVSGYALGAELIEASVIAEDPFHLDYQLAMLGNYRPTILITTPTNAHELVRLLDERQLDPQSLHLRTILLSRPVSAELREELRAGLFAEVRCNFGIGEILDPGMCVECEAGRFHVNEDQFLVEIENGELLVTTLCREAMPLLRYQTRVACEALGDKCPCGRTGMALRPGKRLDNRLRVNEMPVYETQIAEVLAQTRARGLPFRVEVSERRITLRIEMTRELFADMIWPIMEIEKEIRAEFFTRLGIAADVRFTAPERDAMP
jgi:phenylacetate-CoA ligase